MKNVLTIFKKELKRFLSDKRMLFTLLMPGLLIFTIYSLMGNFMGGLMSGDVDMEGESQTYMVHIENRPTEFEVFDTGMDIVVSQTEDFSAEEKKQRVADGKADLYIVYEEDFYQKALNYHQTGEGSAPQVEIYYNSTSTSSQIMYSYYTACLESFEQQLSNVFDVNAGEKAYDLATDSDLTTYILSLVLPMLLNVLLLSGCMATAAESVAGEKERGTVATLLVTPIKRSHLALGKVLALAVVSLISATSSFLGLILSLPSLIGVELTAVPYVFTDYLLILSIIIVNVLLFTVIMTVISTFAKSVKEASGMASPIMILVMVLSLASSFIPLNGLAGYFIPIFNAVLCLSEVVSLSFNPVGFLITIGVNAVVFALGVFVLSKMFKNEKIMFNK